MDAKEYYKSRGFVDKDDPLNPNDQITLTRETLFDLMEGYAATKPYSPEVARRLIAIRDSYSSGDLKSFLNHLHRIADPTGEITKANGNVWVEMELMASEAKELP